MNDMSPRADGQRADHDNTDDFENAHLHELYSKQSIRPKPCPSRTDTVVSLLGLLIIIPPAPCHPPTKTMLQSESCTTRWRARAHLTVAGVVLADRTVYLLCRLPVVHLVCRPLTDPTFNREPHTITSCSMTDRVVVVVATSGITLQGLTQCSPSMACRPTIGPSRSCNQRPAVLAVDSKSCAVFPSISSHQSTSANYGNQLRSNTYLHEGNHSTICNKVAMYVPF